VFTAILVQALMISEKLAVLTEKVSPFQLNYHRFKPYRYFYYFTIRRQQLHRSVDSGNLTYLPGRLRGPIKKVFMNFNAIFKYILARLKHLALNTYYDFKNIKKQNAKTYNVSRTLHTAKIS